MQGQLIYIVIKLKKNQKGLELNGKRQLVIYADVFNFLS
jgi:hypothetical protein